jgi:hypothetical protein
VKRSYATLAIIVRTGCAEFEVVVGLAIGEELRKVAKVEADGERPLIQSTLRRRSISDLNSSS